MLAFVADLRVEVVLVGLISPSVEMFFPESHGEVFGVGDERVVLVDVFVGPEEWVHKCFEVVIDVTPYAYCFNFELVKISIMLTIIQKRPKFTRINMIRQKREQIHIKLKRSRKLMQQLMHTIQKLNKNRTPLILIRLLRHKMPTPQVKLMSKGQPVLLYQHLKPLDRSEVRV